MSTQQERAAKAREQKLAAIEQVPAGSRVIREMTAAERQKYPRLRTPPRSRRRS